MLKVTAILGSCLIVVLVSGGSLFGQTHEVRLPRAVKFDEFGQLGHCDVTARLDNFAVQLQNEPSARGAMISYGPEGDGPGTGKRVLEMIKDYLVNARGLTEDRLKTIYGGRNSDKYQSHTELWIVPNGAALPKPEKRESNVETFQGFYLQTSAYDDFGVDYPEEMGPGIGNSTYASFAEMLNLQKNAIGYVVVYSDEDSLPGAWRRVGQRDIDSFNRFNIEPSRFKLIFGGQQKESKIQYWILPQNASPPVRDAGEEKALAKTVKAGDFSGFLLDDENNQKAIFSRLSEILTLDKTVRAFLVVTLEQPDPQEATEAPPVYPLQITEEPIEDKPPVDLTKLVEKWRADLANTHKVGPDRLIIVFKTEVYGGLGLWIVPKGAPLPDPNEGEEIADESADDPPVKP